ncbi:MAG: hypothetical protein O7C72_07925 [Deltaproteobacteria bacterium]|nr:hypothetical protein [Deltaproteobacteria bacterium]
MEFSADEIQDSLEHSGKIPHGWRPARGGVRKVKVKNAQILTALHAHYSGEWRKVYRRGRDGTEHSYFEHRRPGKVWGIKVK